MFQACLIISVELLYNPGFLCFRLPCWSDSCLRSTSAHAHMPCLLDLCLEPKDKLPQAVDEHVGSLEPAGFLCSSPTWPSSDLDLKCLVIC